MKYWPYVLLLTIISCNTQPGKGVTAAPGEVPAQSPAEATTQKNNEICWEGTINGKIPVLLHYREDSNVVIGEIIYLNTGDKQPIKLLGTIEEDKSYRLMEFEKTGNITGIITGKPSSGLFNGSWFSPKTRKEFALSLTPKDTVISLKASEARLKEVYGKYHYQYSEAGYQGDLEISRLQGNKAVFSITAVTEEPGRNLAQVQPDTIFLNATHFIYNIPGADHCEFEVKFYSGFAYIRYTKGYCDGLFGMNATVDGIFLKVR